MYRYCSSIYGQHFVCSVICWGNSITASDRSRINKFIKKSVSITELTLDSLETVCEKGTRSRVQIILQFEDHPLSGVFNNLKSVMSDRFRRPGFSTEPFRSSFMPTAVKF